ncbi:MULTISPECIES: folylpolyglutamate synthase/dihydrofolate synthase family protein [unclassified Wenzhouxiangella]|uniref:bifunctional folylpolyglutamate synthase/dihydrofolate synthase n=1 Tax=unclassified Wenzhouxiangella TaxID=2613841 RepID=UPI000E3278E3|nr:MULTISPECIES: Mur ligase family protein [unclassified Wenzhouxiangella]RFF27631.1 bifunctional folylpolyglutamate synthase/dihydrofolate synthase [Wenzhouxiangella sp. 15181]RFP70154.1 bifunctional folylpolyglutamate synthase/dihydrofolate synthase [Wenzhouxiangella sp. 15190]
MNTSSNPNLTDWLDRLERRAPASRIELGLERVQAVWRRMDAELSMPVITVAGTNGKGSVVAMLESMLIAGGYRPMAYTSPHILRFAERMRIAGREAEETDIVDALEHVERARADIALTYFEQTTLAAFRLAARAGVDAIVLEVGLGGRLDAVNVVDADVVVITSIDIDHAEFLGDTRERIACEKAGVARAGRPVIVGEPDPPASLNEALESIGACVIRAGECLGPAGAVDALRIVHGDFSLELPRPPLLGDWQRGNAACAVIALIELADRLPVTEAQMAAGLRDVRLPGRFQIVRRNPEVILDVAHNPAAAAALASALGRAQTNSIAVFSALAGKDVAGIGRALDACFTRWLVAPLDGDRAQPAGDIAAELEDAPVSGTVETVESVPAALQQALADSGPADRVVVFGSFLTVAEAWIELSPKAH